MLESALPPTLVIDDDDVVRKTCVELLEARGHRTLSAATVGEGLRLFAEHRPAAVLLDLRLPDGTGIDVLRELQRQAPGTPVVVISGHGSVSEAVEAMKVGATDFLEKPVSRDRLFQILDRILHPPLPGGEADLEKVADGSRYGMVGRSEAMRRIYQLIEMAAPDASAGCFIAGESGTGKELIARRDPRALAPARAAVRRAQLRGHPRELIESEMFGHVKGAFTGAVSRPQGQVRGGHGGHPLPRRDRGHEPHHPGQAAARPPGGRGDAGGQLGAPARWTCASSSATSKNLPEEIARGAFREDLYHRINVFTVAVPPLRNRREDIPELAEHFLRLASVENGVKPKRLSPRAVDLLIQLPWQGNVRELRNLMERLVVLVAKDVVGQQDVMDVFQMPGLRAEETKPPAPAPGPGPVRAPVHPLPAVREPRETSAIRPGSWESSARTSIAR